jgi:hypothetical protein
MHDKGLRSRCGAAAGWLSSWFVKRADRFLGKYRYSIFTKKDRYDAFTGNAEMQCSNLDGQEASHCIFRPWYAIMLVGNKGG